MNDETKQLIKYAAMIAAGYFVYEWLQSSGLWAQWFGGTAPAAAASNSFSNPSALLTYCQANPNGTAIYVDPTTGVTSTASCAQWIASNSSSPTSVVTAATPNTAPASSLPLNYQQAIAAIKTAAGSDSQTIDEWGYFWQNGTIFSGGPAGFGVSGSISAAQAAQMQGFNGNNSNAPISAEQFVSWLNQTTGGPFVQTLGGTTQAITGMQGFADFGDFNPDWIN
jgi:hypothetical protein